MLWDDHTRQKPTVLVTIVGCVGLLFFLIYALSSEAGRARIDRFLEETMAANIEVVQHKQSGEYFAKLSGGRLVKLSGREEADAIAEHGYSACESCR
ncbi:hypothetical protein [Tropicimonas sp. IMCC6043]|uniref:hypothetical protein n=1 Tax=Tropicimonas sp. IMCC6043 TaxID=2510645 RepID=UPI00101BAC2C|nr:hypothetical protein [Tropicimonas sp. IMCC6043]RYH09612.1 hypothetical protein EU800_11730 [Tropicimonas sp. IMCC6043]